MRHYLDQYVRLAAENFEKELTRVAGFDEQAKTILANSELQLFLKKIDTGKIKSPSKEFEKFHMWFQTDDKYCNRWASTLYYQNEEKLLFDAAANLFNALGYLRHDLDLAEYCKSIGFTFPDGWPNDPERFAETLRLTQEEQNRQDKQKPLSLIQRLKQWLT